jgi:hypothetical protein
MLRSEDTSFEETAKKLAEAIGGEAENTGGDVWLAMKELENGSFLVFSLEEIGLYKSRQSMEEGDRALVSIPLYGESILKERRCDGCSAKIKAGEVFFHWKVDDIETDYCWVCDGDIRARSIEATDGAKTAEFIKAIIPERNMRSEPKPSLSEKLNGRGEAIQEELARDL